MLARTSQPDPVFKVDRLTIGFPGTGTTPIDNFSLDIGKGEITCLLGPSGCGKTTLLRALGGFVRGKPSGGVLFQNHWLEAPTPEIVMIFQENNLFPWLNVRKNVGFGLPYASGTHAEKQARLDAMLERVGLAHAAGQYPSELSGGMRQRAAIARALVTDPKVVLLDEPFSALDVGLRRRMHVMLREMWAATHTTFVMVTHNVEEALTVGNRVIVLGNRPMSVLLDERLDDDRRDRYDPQFLAMQRRIEQLIDTPDDNEHDA